jgi:hypothetical protein
MSLNKLIGYRGKRLRIEDFRNFSRCDRFFKPRVQDCYGVVLV